MKKVLAIILAILFTLPVCALALDYSNDLDQQAAVKRIEDAKTHFVATGEGSDSDAPVAKVINDYLDIYNTGVLIPTQRLVIINYN